MTQQEFEALYGKRVGENEFEVINAMYMLDDNETKQEFVTRYKKMGKDELMDAYIRLNSNSKKYTDGLNKQIKDLAGRATVSEQMVAVLKQEQPAAQTAATPDGISIHTDENGENWVRVKILDEDFLIAAHDYKEGETDEFKWQDAMDAMAKIGRAMWTKKQMHLVAACIEEINEKMCEIGGDELEGYYWSSTEYSYNDAWLVHFSGGGIYNYTKYASYYVRPLICKR